MVGVGGSVGLFVETRSIIVFFLYSRYLVHVCRCATNILSVKCSAAQGVSIGTIQFCLRSYEYHTIP